jgi:hypothetical protein
MKITVSQAASQLGVGEEIYRLAMSEVGFSDADTITEIDLDTAAMIAEVVSARAFNQALLPSTDRPLPVEAQEQIINGVQSVLADFEDCLSLDLIKISQAIAFINAKKITSTYLEIHSQVLREDLSAYSKQVGEMFLRSTQSTVSNQDFFKQQGFQSSKVSVKDTLRKVQQLIKQQQ